MATYWSKERARTVPRKRKESAEGGVEVAQKRKVLKCTHTFALSTGSEPNELTEARGSGFTTKSEQMAPDSLDIVSTQKFEVKDPSCSTLPDSCSTDSHLRPKGITTCTEGSSLELCNPGCSTDTEGILDLAAGDLCTSIFDESTPWGVELILETKWIRMKRAAMVEFESKINKMKEYFKADKQSMEEKYLRDISNFEDQTTTFQELVQQKEKVVIEKDIVISNLTRVLQVQQDRMVKSKAFSIWRMKCVQHKQKELMLSVNAQKHYTRKIKQKVFRAWQSLTKHHWQAKVQEFYESRSEQYCREVSRKADANIEKLNKELFDTRKEIENLNEKMNSERDLMKQTFLRGVSALNAETMKLFASTDSNTENITCSQTVGTWQQNAAPIPAPRRFIPKTKEMQAPTEASTMATIDSSLVPVRSKTVLQSSKKKLEPIGTVERHLPYKQVRS